MRNIEQRLTGLEASAERVSTGPRRIIVVDEIEEPGNVEQRLVDAHNEAGPQGLVVHVRCIGGVYAES